MSINKGIPILTGFEVKTANPLDVKSVVKTLDELHALKGTYDGMRVSCLQDKTVYVMWNGVFEPLKGGTTSGEFTYAFPFALDKDIKTEEDYLIRIP